MQTKALFPIMWLQKSVVCKKVCNFKTGWYHSAVVLTNQMVHLEADRDHLYDEFSDQLCTLHQSLQVNIYTSSKGAKQGHFWLSPNQSVAVNMPLKKNKYNFVEFLLNLIYIWHIGILYIKVHVFFIHYGIFFSLMW